jgi:ribonuclease Z
MFRLRFAAKSGFYLFTSLLSISTLATAADRFETKVVLLGTGTPRPFPDRSGPATAIVVGDRAYLVDFGPGVVRRAAAAAEQGAFALDPAKITVAFATHLHSDHTAGLPDLILIPWVMGRSKFDVYGPAGTQEMTDHVLAAWHRDIEIRTQGLERRQPQAVRGHDAQPGVVYKDDKVTVTAFLVPHGEWPQAFGYRFDAPGRSIVISGDTSPGPALEAHCQHCDVLIHETYSPSSTVPSMPDWRTYRSKHHTSTEQLSEIASRTRPGLLIVYHVSGRGSGPGGRTTDAQLLNELHQKYSGKVVIGKDLEIY